MLPIAPYSTAFEDCGSTGASSKGTAIGTGYTQLIAATGFTYGGIILDICQAADNAGAMLTLALGAAASEKDLISNLYISSQSTSQDQYSSSLTLPLHIPAGVRLSAKASSASRLVAKATGFGGGSPAARGFSNCVTMGDSSPSGTTIDPGGSANTKGSWVQMAASTSANFAALMLLVGGAASSAHLAADLLVDIGIGGAGSETVLIPNLYLHSNSATDAYRPNVYGPFPCNIPAATRLSIRAQSSGNTVTQRNFDAVLYGFY